MMRDAPRRRTSSLARSAGRSIQLSRGALFIYEAALAWRPLAAPLADWASVAQFARFSRHSRGQLLPNLAKSVVIGVISARLMIR